MRKHEDSANSEEEDDRTVAVPRPSANGTEGGRDDRDDQTVVVARSGGDDVDRDAEVDDRTVAVAGPDRPHRRADRERREAPRRQGGPVAPPVEEPETDSSRLRTTGGTASLDPERRIEEPPPTAPWERTPVPEPGVRPGLPIVYGARPDSPTTAAAGPDEVQRRIGPPPGEGSPKVVDRPELPSLERRNRRRSAVTLAGYGAAILISIGGLWAVVRIAFG